MLGWIEWARAEPRSQAAELYTDKYFHLNDQWPNSDCRFLPHKSKVALPQSGIGNVKSQWMRWKQSLGGGTVKEVDYIILSNYSQGSTWGQLCLIRLWFILVWEVLFQPQTSSLLTCTKEYHSKQIQLLGVNPTAGRKLQRVHKAWEEVQFAERFFRLFLIYLG